MEYPEEMKEFKDEMKELSEYLTDLKQNDKLGQIDNKKVGKIFSSIIKKIEEVDQPELGQDIADVFLYNLNNLYKEIGNKLAVENEEMLATMVLVTFRNVISLIANNEDGE